MSYNDKIELVADEMVKFAKRKIEMEFDGTLRRQRHQLECSEAYYEIYKKHFGDLIDHRISDKISVLGGCLGCLFTSICESTMEIDEMSTTIEKYIRLQVKTMNLWSC
jgi:hypothetical protein